MHMYALQSIYDTCAHSSHVCEYVRVSRLYMLAIRYKRFRAMEHEHIVCVPFHVHRTAAAAAHDPSDLRVCLYMSLYPL